MLRVTRLGRLSQLIQIDNRNIHTLRMCKLLKWESESVLSCNFEEYEPIPSAMNEGATQLHLSQPYWNHVPNCVNAVAVYAHLPQ